MANLDRLLDTPENHAVREDIKAYLTAAMGQTIELA
jgi:phage baseplate assembly protein W